MQNNTNSIDRDAHIERELQQCVTSERPKSFFLFAGAGSGKTASLVKLLQYICDEKGTKFVRERKKVAVITFTNAAAEEIKRRVNYNAIAAVSTIHSFVWNVIQPFQKEIKEEYLQLLNERLTEKVQRFPKARNKEALSEEIAKLKERIEAAAEISQFIYNPNGDNVETNSLNHEDVIIISSRMLSQKPMLQTIMVSQYPILFIDESQDTRAELMRTFIGIQRQHKDRFLLGLFGDMKQRIYTAGEDNIEGLLDTDWATPVKVMNWRSDKRIVKLINKIASTLDDKEGQVARSDASSGTVRMFVIDNASQRSDDEIEQKIKERMSADTKDDLWNSSEDVKTLVLEHHIAASRLGFEDVFIALSTAYKNSMGFMDGTLPELQFFSERVLPFVDAVRNDNKTIIYEVLREHSPWFRIPDNKKWNNLLQQLKESVDQFASLLQKKEPTIGEVAKYISDHNIFDTPETIKGALKIADTTEEQEEIESSGLLAWRSLLDVNLCQVKAFLNYVKGKSRYDTHQGVKGLQFPRVMVVIDDKASRGFLFKYEKLFGVAELSKTDIAHIENSEDNVILRTQRLFYVVCSRAVSSLSIVAYTESPEKLITTVKERGWFEEDEIIRM